LHFAILREDHIYSQLVGIERFYSDAKLLIESGSVEAVLISANTHVHASLATLAMDSGLVSMIDLTSSRLPC
jgi:predicted dehydrogenase